MKVGILTFHSSYNFGANLQTLAVQEALRHRGCSPVVIDYRNPWTAQMYGSRVLPAQARAHEQFIEKYLNTSPRFSCGKEVQEYCDDELDVVLVGSDQVLRLIPQCAPRQVARRMLRRNRSSAWTQVDRQLPVYWLPWSRNGRGPARMCLSASAGATMFPCLGRSLRREARRSLLSFDFVSVRDDWTGLMVRWLSGGQVKPEFCPDPVFGLNDYFTIPAEEIPDVDVSKTILVSGAIDRTWLAGFREIAHDHGLKISNLPDPHETFTYDQADVVIDLPLSPLAWYVLLSRAAGYIGGRFHGLVTCVANHTPVVSLELSHKPKLLKATSRTYDLCAKAHARARYVPMNWLARPSPASVMNRLMDRSSQAAVDRYAEQAKERLARVFDGILAGVGGAAPVRTSCASGISSH